METGNKTRITVEAIVQCPIEKAWELWTSPEHIMKWNNASEEWHTPRAVNDLKVGGRFLSRMEAKDGSFGFDFVGVYDEVIVKERIAYTMGDGRIAIINFKPEGSDATRITETFEAEGENPVEMQKEGWQAILNNFKKYAESK
jgi:uncharacterized protein YndB with AHSA1/START domain